MTRGDAASLVGIGKAEAIGKLIDALTVIHESPRSNYLAGEKLRIEKAIAILIGEAYDVY